MYLNRSEKINCNGSIIVGWIDPHIKTDSKPLLVNPNPNQNKPWILAENKIFIKPKQALGCS
jgi:hypothetical protein